MYEINGKKVGEILDNKFCKHASLSKHYFWKYNGWGIQEWIIRDLMRKDIEKIVIHETDQDEYWVTTLRNYARYGERDDLGAGQQRFVDKIHWQLYDKNHQRLDDKVDTPKEKSGQANASLKRPRHYVRTLWRTQ